MAAITLVTAGQVRIVGIPKEQFTIPANEAVTGGQAVRLATDTGKLTKANASSAAEARLLGIATRTPEATGLGITVVRRGVLDGYDLSGLDYDAPVYLSDTDGSLDDASGTNKVRVGRVVPGTAVPLGSAYDKLLLVEIDMDGDILEVSHSALLVADQIDRNIFIANRAYQVVAASEVHTTQESAGTLNIQLMRCQGTEAPSAGDALLTNNTNAGFNGVATAQTVQNGTLIATVATLQLAAGDRLALDYTGDVAGELAGVLVTVTLKAI